jgi:hypothetical protein
MQIGRKLTKTMVCWRSRLAVVVLLWVVADVADAPVRLGALQNAQQDARARRDAWISNEEIARLPPDLRDAIERDPFTFFRRVNRVWNERVCTAFRGEDQPKVRLHGDAHVEQYALTRDAYGLDDFDDSAEGPAVIDLVRFIGSLRLAAMQRHWQSRVDRPIDAFLDGYRRALTDPSYAPPEPSVVHRLRLRRAPTPRAFLASVEALMEPAPAPVLPAARHALENVSTRYPELPAGYFTIKKLGALQMGVGSYTAAKFLIRIEGPSLAADDDVILEAKEVSDLDGVGCITTPQANEAVRILIGAQQIGRLHHAILSIFPGLAAERPTDRDWWLRSWDRTYLEVKIQDLRSIEELDELARDAGTQLGSTGIGGGRSAATAAVRQRALETVVRLQPRVRQVAADLTSEMLAAWRR